MSRSRFRLMLVALALASVLVAAVEPRALFALAGLAALVAVPAPVTKRFVPPLALALFALIPYTFSGPGTTYPYVTPGLALMAYWVVAGRGEGRVELPGARSAGLVLNRGAHVVLGAWIGIATLWAFTPKQSAYWAFSFICLALAVSFLLASYPAVTSNLMTTWAYLAAGIGVFAVLEAYVFHQNPLYGRLFADAAGSAVLQGWSIYRATATLGFPLLTSTFLAVGCVIALGRRFRTPDHLMAINAAAAAAGVVATGSRSGILAVLIGALACGLANLQSRSARVRLAMLGGLGVLASFPLYAYLEKTIIARQESSEAVVSSGARVLFRQRALEAIQMHPWAGFGTDSSDVASRAVGLDGSGNFENSPLELTISLGLIGAALLLVLVITALVLGLRSPRPEVGAALLAYWVCASSFNLISAYWGAHLLLGFLLAACSAARSPLPDRPDARHDPGPSTLGAGEYLGLLRRQAGTITLVAAFGLGCAGLGVATTPRTYTAQQQLFITMQSYQGDAWQLAQGDDFIEQRMTSYAQLLTSARVLEPVIRQLRLEQTPAQLAGQIEVQNPKATVLLDIAVGDRDAATAAAIARAMTGSFETMVNSIEAEIGTPGLAVVPVRVAVTRTATEPAGPSSPKIPLMLLLGLALGAGCGVGVGILRDAIGARQLSALALTRLTGAAPLALVPHDRSTRRHPLLWGAGQSPRAEAYRTLRTNVQFLDVVDGARVLVVTSPLTGEGKTTTALNLATSLTTGGRRALLIDADLRRPRVATRLGLSDAVGLVTVLTGRLTLSDVTVAPDRITGLSVLPAGPVPPNPAELVGSQRMLEVIREALGSHDYVIIDSPAVLLATDAASVGNLADGVLLVAAAGRSDLGQVQAAMAVLDSAQARLLGTVLNRVPDGAPLQSGSPRVDTAKVGVTAGVHNRAGNLR